MAVPKGAAILLLCIIFIIPYVSSQSCSAGWKYITGRCYRRFDEDVTWVGARQSCQTYGGDLVVIKSMDLQNQLTVMTIGSLGSFWMGLSYNSTVSNFIWIDSTELDPDITRWMPGEPNNAGNGEDCVEMYGTSGLWNDDSCGGSAGYICDRGTGLKQRAGFDFPHAQNISTRTLTEQQTRIPQYGGNNVYQWVKTVELMFNEEDVGEWNDINCSQVTGYVCQRNIDKSNPEPPTMTNSCIEGYVSYEESCFRVITSEITFQAAGAACQNDGYTLASIHDVYEQSFVETLLYQNGENPLWIGMSNDPISGEYTWQDGWPTFYTNWAFQEPSQGVNEGCVVIGVDGEWDDTRCALNYGAVCKYTSLDKPTHPPDTPGTCPDGWYTSGNDCFLVKAAILDLASFPEAQYLCNGYGAKLASIHTALEIKIIFDAITITATDVWIGMDREPDGPYEWLDGTSVNYLNWDQFQPSYTHGETLELCVEIYPHNGKWNDRECLQKQGYVCRASKNQLNPGTGPTEPRSTTTPRPSQGMSAGAITGIVIGVLAAFVLSMAAVYFFASRDRVPPASKDPGLPPSIGFDNALYKSGEDNTVKIGNTDPTAMDA